MEIKIEDYLTNEQIQEIIGEEIKYQVRRVFTGEKEITRILSNLSYDFLFKKVDEVIPNFNKIIKTNIEELMKKDETYNFLVFRRKDNYGGVNSVGQNILEKCVVDNRNIIDEKVKSIFNELKQTDLVYEINGIVESYIENLFKKSVEE